MQCAFVCPVFTVLGALCACSSSSSPGVRDGDPRANTGPTDAGSAFESGPRQDSQVDASANDGTARDGSSAAASDGSNLGDAPMHSDGGVSSAATFVHASWQGGGGTTSTFSNSIDDVAATISFSCGSTGITA